MKLFVNWRTGLRWIVDGTTEILVNTFMWIFDPYRHNSEGTRWRRSFSHCAKSRKVAGPIPDGFIRFFIDIILPISLWLWDSTQPLTEMNTRYIYWGKGSRCVRLTNSPPSRPVCLEMWEPQFSGTLRACSIPYRDRFTFTYIVTFNLKGNLYL